MTPGMNRIVGNNKKVTFLVDLYDATINTGMGAHSVPTRQFAQMSPLHYQNYNLNQNDLD